MKPFKRIFKKKPEAKKVRGITEAEYNKLSNAMAEAYNEAVLRQKPGTTKPSGYMKGLNKALDILEEFMPHDIEVA